MVAVIADSGSNANQTGVFADAREHRQNASISTKWNRLNLVYFLGYAFWGYYFLPHQLMRTDIEWTELGDGLLQADFGTNLPVHSRIQRFWFDKKSGLLRRNDWRLQWHPLSVKTPGQDVSWAVRLGPPVSRFHHHRCRAMAVGVR